MILSVARAEDAWVTDEFEIMLRTGKSNQQSIVRQLKSGTRLEVLETDAEAGYTRVRAGADVEGWVLSRYLKKGPTSRLLLPDVEARLQKSESQRAELSKEVAALKKERQQQQNQIGELQSNNTSAQKKIDRITELSANTIQVDEQNLKLKQRLTDSDLRIELLETENRQLKSRSDREWFLIGGAVLMVGLLLGLILPRISWKKKSSWSDF